LIQGELARQAGLRSAFDGGTLQAGMIGEGRLPATRSSRLTACPSRPALMGGSWLNVRMSLILRLLSAAAGLSLAAVAVACGTVRYSQQTGNLPVQAFAFHGELLRVAAASPSAAWAVGFSGTPADPGTLMLHWDGKTWSRVTSPGVADGAPGILTDVTAVSASDAWAVGVTGRAPSSGCAGADRRLLLHWDGTSWSQVAGVLPASGCLSAIAMSGHDGWLAGRSLVAGRPQALILRREGAGWQRVPAPAGANGFSPARVVITSAGTAWMSGWVPGHGSLPWHSALMRWNGSLWQWASFPIDGPANYLSDLAADPDGTAWAVGSATTATSQPGIRRSIAPLAMRWAGATWQAVHVPPGGKSAFGGVTVAPDGTVWAVGAADVGLLAMRWTGNTWAEVPVPNADSPDEANGSGLTSVAFPSPAYGWAVGVDWVTGKGKHAGDWPLIVHWDGTAWN
jgi:hypothetical protein